MGKSTSGSDVQFYGGQKRQVSGDIFGTGGIWDQLVNGKPNAGFERSQANALDQLTRKQASAGLLNSPLGTRQTSDFLAKSNQMAGDNYVSQLQSFMQPAGSTSSSKSAGVWGGKG